MKTCTMCNGKGEVPILRLPLHTEGWILDTVWAVCPACHGPGFVNQ